MFRVTWMNTCRSLLVRRATMVGNYRETPEKPQRQDRSHGESYAVRMTGWLMADGSTRTLQRSP
ncbi:hypothetical protein VFPBJ_00905 [Purpureocillium lilacinum]|uniref:Uncharacterized protein n=1 Tax=Purpureocillium lilacinum TaxID=33203 RepID=A0A179H9C6_PURLI|nr:hypothetical protein VFPBJ_00905 [Purpureocillium lilacinum]